jgi:AhpD family alkylhydroperoxidase
MERIRIGKVEPDGYKAMVGLHRHVEDAVDRQLNDLVKLRTSQVNGCAYCIDLHWREAREHGEPEHRLYQLDAWREAGFYSDRERAALALTEAVTLVREGHVPDDVYEDASRHFDARELANLILAIVTINAWNRIGISTHMSPGED